MSRIILGVGEYAATDQPGSSLITFALGSCVAVIIFDPGTHCIGMDHIALPDSSINPEKAKLHPGHFADTGITALLNKMKRIGACGNFSSCFAKLAGGAKVLDISNTFNIGQRNVQAIKKTLAGHGIKVRAEDVGDRISRSVNIDVDSGTVVISSPGFHNWTL